MISIKKHLEQIYLAATMQQVPSQMTEAGASKVRTRTCPPQRSPYDSTIRTAWAKCNAHIYAWPSLGGVIILNHANAVDLEFLGLDRLDPPMERLPDQADEDRFCKRLLLLGAKWWESEARYQLMGRVDEMDAIAIYTLDHELEPAPTMAEKRFVSVSWPTTGGFWIAEFDTSLYCIEEEDNLVPDDVARLSVARTMDERSRLLRDRFGARFYQDISDYRGYAFLNAWEARAIEKVETK